MNSLYPLLFFYLIVLAACDNPEKTRGNEPPQDLEALVTQTSKRPLQASDIVGPAGSTVSVFTEGLSYPTDITFDEAGNAYIAEAGGHTYGTSAARAPEARILKRSLDGQVTVLYDRVVPMNEIKESDSSDDMPEGIIPPLIGVTYHDGKLYVAHRSRYSVYDLSTNEFKTIINGLPSWGEFLNGKPIIHDNKLTWYLSTQGNSGVMEEHWVEVIDQFNKPDAREIPGEDITLTGKNFWVPTKKTNLVDADSVRTGAYSALGDTTVAGQKIPGELICNGAFFRSDLDGSNIERINWGMRSNFGYRYSPGGRLVTTMNSANPMAPRGMYFDYETVYEVVEGEWYGWPDYYSGIPITDERFGVKESERAFVLDESTHRRLLKGADRPRQPLVKLEVHSAAQGMVFGKGFALDAEDDILVAEFGAIVPFFKGPQEHPHLPPGVPAEDAAPDGVAYNWPGFRVQRVNLSTGDIEDFIYNEGKLPASATGGGGLERPLQLEWGPDGSLYIVDFGTVKFDDKGMDAVPFTGVIWKVEPSPNK